MSVPLIVSAPPMPNLRSRTTWRRLLAAATAGGVTGVLKGLAPRVADGSEFYWMLSYEHGFVRRAFIGTIVHPLASRLPFEALAPWIRAAHLAVCAWIIYACYALFREAIDREESFDVSTTLLLAFLCLMCSEWLPTLAHDVGYVDVYISALALAGFLLVVRGRYGVAALVAFVGPLIHEGFIFLWSPVAIMLAWSALFSGGHRRGKVLAAMLPLASTAAVIFLQSGTAAARAIDALSVGPGLKDGLRAYEIGQTLQSSMHEMLRYQFPGNGARIGVAAAYLLLPSAALVWAAVFCYRRRWHPQWTMLLAILAASLAPLAVLALAWDLSRFMVWSNLGAAVALIASGWPDLTTRSGR